MDCFYLPPTTETPAEVCYLHRPSAVEKDFDSENSAKFKKDGRTDNLLDRKGFLHFLNRYIALFDISKTKMSTWVKA